MKNYIKNSTAFALAALLCLSLLLVACDGGKQPEGPSDPEQTEQPTEDTTPGSEQETTDGATEDESSSEEETTEGETQPAEIDYTVSVTGSDGNPRQGALVCIFKDGAQLTQAATDKDGNATFALVPDTYTVALSNVLGEKYIEDGCELTPETTSLSIRLYGLPTAGEEIFAYNATADDYIGYMANRIVEGSTFVTLNADDMTYYLFVPSRGGAFRLSFDADLPVSIGYFGSTSFVMTETLATEENNAITVDVYDDMAYNYAFVIGVKAEDAALTECVLTVEYVDERETGVTDLPWVDLMPEGELAQFTKPAGSYQKFDLEGDVVTLVLGSDGYYHVGSADGALVLINLDNSTGYLDALTTVCANQRLGAYVYDEDGNLLSKDSYNELIYAYNAVSDGGYYPLDQAMLDMIIAVGNSMGWYDASSPMYLFGGKVLTVENAHLFACVYLQ